MGTAVHCITGVHGAVHAVVTAGGHGGEDSARLRITGVGGAGDLVIAGAIEEILVTVAVHQITGLRRTRIDGGIQRPAVICVQGQIPVVIVVTSPIATMTNSMSTIIRT